jgi:ATP-dependent Lon protease
MKIYNLLIALCLCLSSVACVNPATKQNTGVTFGFAKNNDASEFLNFSEYYSNLSLEAQKDELVTTNKLLTTNPNSLLQRMKLVMIYGLPSSNLFDGPKAQSLLQQLLQENILANTQLAFGHLLFDHLIAINKVNKNNRDDQKRIESILQKNETLQLKLDATQQKLDAAQQKLIELKNIEKSMSEREVTPRK